MASSNQRSISGSNSIPFSRDPTDAFQDMTAFTPPPENWLIRFPKNITTTTTSNNTNSQTQKKEVENHTKKNTTNINNKKKAFLVPEADQLDDTCKRYIESSEIPVKSNKSLGTDDHFKSAVCSKNLLKVCEKLMTNKEFVVSTSDSVDDDDFDAELSLMNEQSRMEFYRRKHGNRRDSQSLPASPKMERKNQTPVSHNPYFTITKQQESRPDSSISFLTNLFGITANKNTKEAQANLAQKYEYEATNNASNSSKMNNSMFNGGGDRQEQQKQTSSSRQMTPQPHIYREMNIFSPTSM